MRGMNMFQMLGGVAVAGAVAAGTTAFTANGLTAPGATTIGGQADISTIGGLTLSSVVVTWDTSTPAQVTGATVTFNAAVANSTPVQLVIHDSTSHTFTCANVAAAGTSSACTITGFTPGTIDHIYVTA